MIDSSDIAVARALDALHAARSILAAEIGAYPGPISGCDAQFNHLLAQRAQVSRALEALENDVFVPTPRSPMPHNGIESR